MDQVAELEKGRSIAHFLAGEFARRVRGLSKSNMFLLKNAPWAWFEGDETRLPFENVVLQKDLVVMYLDTCLYQEVIETYKLREPRKGSEPHYRCAICVKFLYEDKVAIFELYRFTIFLNEIESYKSFRDSKNMLHTFLYYLKPLEL